MKINYFCHTLPILAATCGLLAGEAETPSPLNQDPVVLDKMTVSAIREKTRIYDVGAQALWTKTEEQKTISYLDVLATAYARAKFDLAETLLAKKAYRERAMKSGHDFFCNYGAISIQVPIRFRYTVDHMTGIKSGEKEFVYYSFEKKHIVIERLVYRTALMQAAGLSLCAHPAPEALERIKKMGAAKKDFAFRQQVNFEVQLQDLNRLYALYSGRPIMTPLDALEALCMLGERPKPEQVGEILTRNGYRAAPGVIERIIRTTQEQQSVVENLMVNDPEAEGPANLGPESFRGAHRLLTEKREKGEWFTVGLRFQSGDGYVRLLEKILIEAPGHI